MSRIMIISENRSYGTGAPGDDLLRIAQSLLEAGAALSVTRNGDSADGLLTIGPGIDIVTVPVEPPRSSGFMFALRNALLFDTAANPGNYAMLRDRLHMHLQEVLYDAVLIVCPPRIYLRLGNWIHETFGIPVWLHLSAAVTEAGMSWNHRRLCRKYLAAATLLTAVSGEALDGIALHPHQAAFIAKPGAAGVQFEAAATGTNHDAGGLLKRIIRKKQHS